MTENRHQWGLKIEVSELKDISFFLMIQFLTVKTTFKSYQ